jgi:mgtE-like transporter
LQRISERARRGYRLPCRTTPTGWWRAEFLERNSINKAAQAADQTQRMQELDALAEKSEGDTTLTLSDDDFIAWIGERDHLDSSAVLRLVTLCRRLLLSIRQLVGRWVRGLVRAWPRVARALVALLGERRAVRQSLVALVLNGSTSLIAGAVLGSVTATFTALPGLLVMVPAAIGLRGNVFSAFGNRLSTSIHTGTFELSTRRGGVVWQNIAASLCLTLGMSAVLAGLAKVVAVALGIPGTVSVLTLALVSIIGGLLASAVVLVAAVLLATLAVRFDWDLDNVTAPLVSTLGDVLTLPALWLASLLVSSPVVASVGGATLLVVAIGALVLGWRARDQILRRIVRESLPVLTLAALLSTLSGVAIEHRLASFAALPALLVLQPAFVSSAGALGGILSARLSSKLHLGIVDPRPWPGSDSRRDLVSVFLLGAPVFLFNAVGAHVVARALGEASPGLDAMVAASMIGGFFAVAFVVVVGYYGTIVSVTVGVDPDTYGIPIVTSSVDLVGAVALIATLDALGTI